MKRLFGLSVVFYCLGIILLSFIRVNFWLIIVFGVIISAVAGLNFRDNRVFTVWIFLLALLLGALSLKNAFALPACHISNFIPYGNNAAYSLSGFIDSQPVTQNKRTAFIFRVQEAQLDNLKWACCGKVLVKLDFPLDLNYADSLILQGVLRRPYGFSSASRSYRKYLSRQDIYLLMCIKSSLQVIPRDEKSGNKLVIFAFWLRDKLEQVIQKYLPDLPAAILSAMVLGQKSSVPWLVNNYMVKSGTVHILVVSGFNVGVVAFIISLLLKIMHIRRKQRIVLTIICLLIYCLITGASNPVIRATVMGVVFLSGHLLKREADIYNCLACAALFILVISPRQLFDLGFQLSFASVLAIVYFYPKMKSFLRLGEYRPGLLRFICEGCLVSLSAWLGTMGIIAYNFRIISPVTVLANILIVPLSTLITLCGFSLVLCGLFCPFLARVFSTTISFLVALLLNINSAVIKIPGAYFYL
ncbi:MAG: ComEC/Rec2 family competence protein [Candidatus Omnitrophica bacterium]|jgi:competence protein ComEC|nr:ComEC/Rec2 family competence protein [Candidatus Omnitrophota bacterium]